MYTWRAYVYIYSVDSIWLILYIGSFRLQSQLRGSLSGEGSSRRRIIMFQRRRCVHTYLYTSLRTIPHRMRIPANLRIQYSVWTWSERKRGKNCLQPCIGNYTNDAIKEKITFPQQKSFSLILDTLHCSSISHQLKMQVGLKTFFSLSFTVCSLFYAHFWRMTRWVFPNRISD